MNGNHEADIRELSLQELQQVITTLGEKPFRTTQVYDWLWKRGCRGFGEMTNLPASLREHLASRFSFHVMQESHRQVSRDGTTKLGFRLYDGVVIESVLIPANGRTTACISSQAGCAFGCTFCATGSLGFYRNLTASEMFDQVWNLNDLSVGMAGNPLSNIVLMGMGEPLFNYEQVARAIDLVSGEEGMGFSPRRITLSTVGIPKMIRRLADDQGKVNLAISLHAATDEKRNQIIPFNRNHPLQDLSDALRYYSRKSRKRITIEYLLLKEFNDFPEDARALLDFCRHFPVKINLIEYNPVEGSGFRRSEIRKIKHFRDILEAHNLVVNIRQSRGKDVDAACGQLAGGAGQRTWDVRRGT